MACLIDVAAAERTVMIDREQAVTKLPIRRSSVKQPSGIFHIADCVRASSFSSARDAADREVWSWMRRRYFGLSRCTTLTRYPARRRCLPTSSAIITERCWPPVQPKAIVR